MALVEHTLGAGTPEIRLGLVMHFFAAALAKRVFGFRPFDGGRNYG
jgi:hypothetical protein